jgi:hypothetical protein
MNTNLTESCDDESFLSAIDISGSDAKLALEIRQVLAHWCNVPPDNIRAEDRPLDCHRRMKSGWARGWDETGFLIKLEDEFDYEVNMQAIRRPPFLSWRFLFWGKKAPANLGEWIKQAIPEIKKHLKDNRK